MLNPIGVDFADFDRRQRFVVEGRDGDGRGRRLEPEWREVGRLVIDGADQRTFGNRAREVVGLRLIGVGADWLHEPPRLALVAFEHDVAIGILEFNFRDVVLLDGDQFLGRLGLRNNG